MFTFTISRDFLCDSSFKTPDSECVASKSQDFDETLDSPQQKHMESQLSPKHEEYHELYQEHQ